MKFCTNEDSRNQEKISAEERLNYIDRLRCISRPIEMHISTDQDSCSSEISLSFSTIGSKVLMELKNF